jgi:AmiR/NasT family two-component response regulator
MKGAMAPLSTQMQHEKAKYRKAANKVGPWPERKNDLKLDMALSMRNAATGPLRGHVVGRGLGDVPAADADGVKGGPGLFDPGARVGTCRFTSAVLRYTTRNVKQGACQCRAAGVSYAFNHHLDTAVNFLVVVLPVEAEGGAPAWPAALQDALAVAGVSVAGVASCRTMVQQAQALAPRHLLVCMPAPIGDLIEALQAWAGAPPCALSLVSAPLDRDAHEQLAALGVHAWAPLEALDGPLLDTLLARARTRWQREHDLRTELEALRTRMDERKWVDRAKGLLMAARGIGEDEAFGLLRGASMHANLRLGEVARSVVEASQWADAINRAGQLRMLSQRLVRLAAQTLAGIDARRARALRTKSVERVEDNLRHLAALDLDEDGARALSAVQLAWQGLEGALSLRLAPRVLSEVELRAEALLSSAEALTGALEASGARRALHIVNICGRQRMRAQRLAKDALLAATLSADASRERLAPTMAEFEAALLELERAPLSSPEIRTALAAAHDEWLRLVRGVRDIDSAEGRAALVRASDVLVDTFDQLTASYENSLQVIMS